MVCVDVSLCSILNCLCVFLFEFIWYRIIVCGAMCTYEKFCPTWYEYTIKYHYGGALMIEGDVTYVNGDVVQYVIGIEKLCHRDLLDDVKEIGPDIKKDIRLSLRMMREY